MECSYEFIIRGRLRSRISDRPCSAGQGATGKSRSAPHGAGRDRHAERLHCRRGPDCARRPRRLSGQGNGRAFAKTDQDREGCRRLRGLRTQCLHQRAELLPVGCLAGAARAQAGRRVYPYSGLRGGSLGRPFLWRVRPEPNDPIVTKHHYSAFYNTDLDTVLRANGIRSVVLTGVVTNVCVETSAREAFIRDYYVVVVSDGTAAYVHADHDMTL